MPIGNWIDTQPNIAAGVQPDATMFPGGDLYYAVRFDAEGGCWYITSGGSIGEDKRLPASINGQGFPTRAEAIDALEAAIPGLPG